MTQQNHPAEIAADDARGGLESAGAGRPGRIRRGIKAAAVAAAVTATTVLAAGATPASAATSAATSETVSFTTGISLSYVFYLQFDIDGSSGSPGAPLIDWPVNFGENQAFTFQQVGSYWEIINEYSAMCLYGDGQAGHGIVQEPCNGGPGELWQTYFSPSSGSIRCIENPASGLYMDVDGFSWSQGTPIIQWYYNGGANQYFSGPPASTTHS